MKFSRDENHSTASEEEEKSKELKKQPSSWSFVFPLELCETIQITAPPQLFLPPQVAKLPQAIVSVKSGDQTKYFTIIERDYTAVC